MLVTYNKRRRRGSDISVNKRPESAAIWRKILFPTRLRESVLIIRGVETRRARAELGSRSIAARTELILAAVPLALIASPINSAVMSYLISYLSTVLQQRVAPALAH